MAQIQIPPPDVTPIEVDPETGRFRWTRDWYDVLKALERVGVLDLADVSPTPPLNNQVLIWNNTTKLWTPGAN